MRPSRFSDEEIVQALQLVRSGTPAVQVCRRLGITQTTFYRWRARFERTAGAEQRELRSLRDENEKLRQIVTRLLLDNERAAPPRR
jgi:putative transposase